MPLTIEQQLNVLWNFVSELDERVRAVEARSGVARSDAATLRQSLEALSRSHAATDALARTHATTAALSAETTTRTENVRALQASIDGLVNQTGLLAPVSTATRQELTALGNQIALLQSRFEASQKDELFLSNLAYAYALLASHWKVSRDHVRAVIAEPTAGQTLLKVSTTVFITGLQIGFAAFTGGLSTTLFHAIAAPAFSIFGSLGASHLNYSQVDPSGGPSQTVSGQTRATATMDVAKDTYSPASGAVFGALGGKLIPDPYSGPGDAAASLTDPYEFFLDLEKELRKVAVALSNERVGATQQNQASRSYLSSVSASFTAAKTKTNLDELKDPAESYFAFLFEPMTSAASAAKWGELSALFAVHMRRLAWRMYCRSQWSNTLWNYSVCGDASFTSTDPALQNWKTDKFASDWPYKCWTSQGIGGWPAHWGQICGDFRGPEHIPDHPFNARPPLQPGVAAPLGPTPRELATIAEKRKSWISMAVVQCCQIKRSGDGLVSRDYRIDLEKNRHIGGVSGDELDADGDVTVDPVVTDYGLVFGDFAQNKELLDAIQTGGGNVIKIFEVRFGSAGGSSLTKASGKKGILFSPNSENDPMMPKVEKGARITVRVQSTSKTSRDAEIFIATSSLRDTEGKPTDTSAGTTALSRDKKSFVMSTTQWTNLTAPSTAGKFCITLSSRLSLRKGRGDSRQFHVPSEWWFWVVA